MRITKGIAGQEERKSRNEREEEREEAGQDGQNTCNAVDDGNMQAARVTSY